MRSIFRPRVLLSAHFAQFGKQAKCGNGGKTGSLRLRFRQPYPFPISQRLKSLRLPRVRTEKNLPRRRACPFGKSAEMVYNSLKQSKGAKDMHEIKCPNCGQVFQVDESGYAQIVKQVRDEEFAADLKKREAELLSAAGKDNELKLMEREKEYREGLARKDADLVRLELELEKLRAKIASSESEAKLAVAEAVRAKDEALFEKTAEITELRGKLEGKDAESLIKENSLKERYEKELSLKDEQIQYYREFKARQSTKMVGESLEQHCLTQFNSIRMAAFPNAYFEKDNDSRTGSKGDFIFRECGEDGTELISIMFEMKNEMDTTATKHRNEDFFKELDKDRREKNCEYAVLVSLLESESELYNGGIVDVSYRYEKMYVIRPQFFIPIISLLRNAALNSQEYRRELKAVRDQQLDVLHFEQNMNAFKEAFGRNYRLASERFGEAMDEIDKAIQHLEKIKKALRLSADNLRLANTKAEDLSIKKLTKNAPSVKAMFDEAGSMFE